MAENDKKGDKKTKMTKKQDKKQKMGFIPYKKGGHNRISRINRDTPSSYGESVSGKLFIPTKPLRLCKFFCNRLKTCTKRNGDKNKGKTPCLYKPKNQHKCEKAEFVGENEK